MQAMILNYLQLKSKREEGAKQITTLLKYAICFVQEGGWMDATNIGNYVVDSTPLCITRLLLLRYWG